MKNKKPNPKISKIEKDLFVVKGNKASGDVIVQFGVGSYVTDVVDKGRHYGALSPHYPWGDKDQKLAEMHEITGDNPTKWQLMMTRRDFVIGNGLRVRNLEEGDEEDKYVFINDAEQKIIAKKIESLGVQKTLRELAMQLEFSGRYFAKFTLGLDLKTESIELVDVFQCRPKKLAVGETRISAYILNPNFGSPRFKVSENQEIPAFDPKEPTKYPVFILDGREHLPGMFYNTLAAWWGTKEWAIISNKIAKFHNSGLDNGYNLKYHVSIPDDYFNKDGLTEEETEELKDSVLNEISESLKGINAVNKTLFTFHQKDVTGKAMNGVVITPLDNKMTDNAYMNIFNMASVAQASAHKLLPTLAGVDQNQKLGGSGKELEVAANYTQSFLTNTDRNLLLEVFNVLKMIEGWSAEKVGVFQNVRIYNYDVTPKAAAV